MPLGSCPQTRLNISESSNCMTTSVIKFCKTCSSGQDFIVVDARREIGKELAVLGAIACNRYAGIGAEALIAIENSCIADFKSTSFNTNGIISLSENGVRCAARYIHDQQLLASSVKKFSIETYSHRFEVEIIGKGDRVRVNLGHPAFLGHLIPTTGLGEQLNVNINVDGTSRKICAVGMGEAHCVLFLTGIDYFDICNMGTQLEKHPYFPKGCVVDFAEIVDPEMIKLRCWKMGKENTTTLGYSCCAVAAAAMKLGHSARRLIIRTAAGQSELFWNDNSANIYLTGAVQHVFCGEIDIERYLEEKNDTLLN